MKVHLTVGQVSVEGHGRFLVKELFEVFFCPRAKVCLVSQSIMVIIDILRKGIHYYRVVPALSLDGIIWAKIVEGSFTKPLFHTFIQELLTRMEPFPGRNSVIFMDNARIHKNREMVDMIQER
jgi:hypothetical protein